MLPKSEHFILVQTTSLIEASVYTEVATPLQIPSVDVLHCCKWGLHQCVLPGFEQCKPHITLVNCFDIVGLHWCSLFGLDIPVQVSLV